METLGADSFFEHLINMYETADLPAAILDSELNVLWCSTSGKELQPCLRLPDGARTLLYSHDPEDIRKEVAARGRFTSSTEDDFFMGRTAVICALLDGSDRYLLQPSAAQPQGTAVQPEGISRILSVFNSQYRAPLTVIFSMLTLLAKILLGLTSEQERCKADEYMNLINESAYKLLRSCQWISGYAQFTHGFISLSLHRVDLFHHLRQLCTAAAQVIEPKGIPIEWDIPEGTLTTVCDTEKLSFILLNLLSNACCFTRPGNHIMIRVRKRAKICSISVSDKGLGIPSDLCAKVFEPYFSHRQDGHPFAGTGLGLPSVKNLTAAMGGTVTLTSVEGKGTTVLFTLPLRDDASIPCAVECTAADYLDNRFSLVHVALADSIRPPL